MNNSQWGEEAIVLDFFKGFTGTFLDIGAFDGITNSNTRALLELGWKGVLIEPDPEAFIKLRQNCYGHPVHCICSAVASGNGLKKLYGSNQRASLIKSSEDSIWVSTTDSYDLFDEFGNCDFLSVDAEGSDFEILESMLKLFTPKLICFEDDLPDSRKPIYKQNVLKMLSGFGYTNIVGCTSTDRNSANTLVSKPLHP